MPWKPKGWYVTTRGPVRGQLQFTCGCDGLDPIRGSANGLRAANRAAWKSLMEAIAANLDIGWTHVTRRRVHLRIKDSADALCGAQKLEDSPDINRMETPPCRRCDYAQAVIEKTIGHELGEWPA